MYSKIKVKVGNLEIGGDSPVSIQSMINIPANDVAGTVKQAIELEKNGCEIIRIALPDLESIRLIPELKKHIKAPIVGDIHFNYKIALEAIEAGIDKIRINPGNIGDDSKVKLVADKCRLFNIPIRIGVNSGSLEKSILKKYGHPSAEALCESALYHASLLEKYDFNQIVISIKSSSVPIMTKAYTLISQQCDYPLHLGVTEAGTKTMGLIKSSAGIGHLLLNGIGDTIRYSLTADPIEEVIAAKELLKSLEIKKGGVTFVSCPTCGRTQINLIKLAGEVEERLRSYDKNIKVAVMGCVVNGPGEAREADIGIAGGCKEGLIFKKGEIIKKLPEDQLIDALFEEIDKM